MRNKLCALILIALGVLPVVVDKDITALFFFSLFAVPMFFAKENWILPEYVKERGDSMFVKLYKRTTRDFRDIFTRGKRTKEVMLDLGKHGTMFITEHQLGHPLKQRQVHLMLNDRSYSLNMDELVQKIECSSRELHTL